MYPRTLAVLTLFNAYLVNGEEDTPATNDDRSAALAFMAITNLDFIAVEKELAVMRPATLVKLILADEGARVRRSWPATNALLNVYAGGY